MARDTDHWIRIAAARRNDVWWNLSPILSRRGSVDGPAPRLWSGLLVGWPTVVGHRPAVGERRARRDGRRGAPDRP